MKVINPVVNMTVDRYPDSSFFANICRMQYANDKLYMLDRDRRDVAVMDDKMEYFRTISRGGRGPGELVSASSFYFRNDTLDILDMGTHTIKRFSGDENVAEVEVIPPRSPFHFFSTDSLFFLNGSDETGFFYTVDKKGYTDGRFHGKSVYINNSLRTIKRNGRHLFSDEQYIYAVADALPYVEKYDLISYQLLERCDLSQVGIVKENLRYAAENDPENDRSYWVLFYDACLYEDKIFILSTSLGADYKRNSIIVVSIKPEIKPLAIYQLPGIYYDSFCVSDRYIFAFNSADGQIESIIREDD